MQIAKGNQNSFTVSYICKIIVVHVIVITSVQIFCLIRMYYTYMPEGCTEGIHARKITLAHVTTNM